MGSLYVNRYSYLAKNASLPSLTTWTTEGGLFVVSRFSIWSELLRSGGPFWAVAFKIQCNQVYIVQLRPNRSFVGVGDLWFLLRRVAMLHNGDHGHGKPVLEVPLFTCTLRGLQMWFMLL